MWLSMNNKELRKRGIDNQYGPMEAFAVIFPLAVLFWTIVIIIKVNFY